MSYEPIGESDLAVRLDRLAETIAVPPADDLTRMARRAAGLDEPRSEVMQLPRRMSARPIVRLAAGVAAALLLAALAVNMLRGADVAAAGIRFSDSKGFIVARISDPEASQAALDKAFANHGLNIHLSLLPVTPSLVGTVLYIGENGDSRGADIEALQGGHCLMGGGGCPVGLRIPRAYRGEAYISLGRAARGDESYATTTSAFAPGEPLHCSGLIGKPVAQLRRVLSARGLTAEWALADGSDGGRSSREAVSGDYVVDVEHMAPRRVLVSVLPAPPSHPSSEIRSYRQRLNTGC
jgi:hypothetical protein